MLLVLRTKIKQVSRFISTSCLSTFPQTFDCPVSFTCLLLVFSHMCFSVSFCLPLTVHQFPPRLSFVLCSSVLFSHHQFLPAFPAPHWSVLYLVLCFIICYRICPCLLLFCSSDHSFALFKLSFLFLPRCFCIFLPN